MPTITELRRDLESYWSQSRLNTFLLCSLKYAFQYVHKEKAEHMSAALPFGNAVHRTLEMMARTQRDNSVLGKEELQELFRSVWDNQVAETDQDIKYKDGEDKDSLAESGSNIIGVFRDNLNEEEEVLRVSQAMAVPVPGLEAPLIGELDLLVKNADGKLVIVDWKTAARRWPKDKADKEIQPTALIYAYKQQFGVVPEFEYRIGTKGKTAAYQVQTTTRGEQHFDRLIGAIHAIDRAVKNEVFIPSDGCFACGDCQFASACKAWGKKKAACVSVAA